MDVAPQAVLQWDPGVLEAECERAAEVKAGVEAYLGREVFADGGQVVVRVMLTRVTEGGKTHVVARVTQQDESGRSWGERSVAGGESCASLDEPLTLVVALMVDAPVASVQESPPPEPAPPPPEPPPPEPPTADETSDIETAPSLEHAPPAPAHAAFFGMGALTMGLLPAAGVGGSVLATAKPQGFWGIALAATALAPQREPLGAGSLEASALLFEGALCPLQGADADVWWSACVSGGAARLAIKSRGLIGAKSRRQWFAVPGVGARAAWRVGRRFLLAGGLQALFPVSPDRYVYRDPSGNVLTALAVSDLVVSATVGVGLFLD